MRPRIRAILPQLRHDLAACLSSEAIKEACRAAGHRWRNRALNPVTTVYLFLLQILRGNTACQHVVHFGIWRFSDLAYCQARKRLPLAVFQKLLEQITAKLQQTTQTSSLRLGGTEFGLSMVRASRCPMSRAAAKVRPTRRATTWIRLRRGQDSGTRRRLVPIWKPGSPRTFGEGSPVLIPNGRESPGKWGPLWRLAALRSSKGRENRKGGSPAHSMIEHRRDVLDDR